MISSASAALGWMDDKVIAAAACPLPREGFSTGDFARSRGSVYLIGKKRPTTPSPGTSPRSALSCSSSSSYAKESASGGSPVPATFVLDEMPLTCPLPLHDMLAERREYLITIIAAQTLAQLRAKFGPDDGDTIRSACPVEVHFGGEKRHEDLDAVSEVIGERDTWHQAATWAGRAAGQPLLPPGALRMLAKGKAVILMPECRPVLAALPAIWDRRGHLRADLGHAHGVGAATGDRGAPCGDPAARRSHAARRH